MKDEGRPNCKGWTVDTLHEFAMDKFEAMEAAESERYRHVLELLAAKEQKDEERFKAQKETTALALSAADRAVTKAETAAEKRFESVNEFRSTLADQQRLLIPRNEAELWFKSLSEDVRMLKETNLKQAGQGEGKGDLMKVIGWVAGLIGIAFGIGMALLK